MKTRLAVLCIRLGRRYSFARSRPLIRFCGLGALALAAFAIAGCGKKQAPVQAEQPAAPAATPAAAEASLSISDGSAAGAAASGTLVLPVSYIKRTGDLDAMAKARIIRALVVINPVGFFYEAGHPHGIQYEALQEFEKFANRELKTGKLPVKVVTIPLRTDQLEPALMQGLGDLIAQGVVITPQREQKVAFSIPIAKDVKEVVVTGTALANVSSFDDLAGKDIYVNPLTVYGGNLKTINEDRKKAGKQPFIIRDADKSLFDDDLIEMVNAGLIPATVTNQLRADLWARVLPNVKSHPELAVSSGTNIAWVMRKDSPQLKQMVDKFVESHAMGTSFGNTLLRRYLQNTKWVTNSTSAAELQKFNAYVEYFKKYAGQYNFDYLMLAAQGYQESLLDQDKKSRIGAVGVMQVMPKLAAANPINISDVGNSEGNIHAGVKMMRNIADTYFNDPGIDQMNKTLFTFASYNAGPNRIARLRKKASADGLDPNKWLGNVELEVAKDIGQETVTYVGNIYKYYIAYKLTSEQKQHKQAAMAAK
jgi:membrane-bound lytic murein transglycosylase MltF